MQFSRFPNRIVNCTIGYPFIFKSVKMSQVSSQYSIIDTASSLHDEKCRQKSGTAINVTQLLDCVNASTHNLQELLNSTDTLVKFLGYVFQEAMGERVLQTVCSGLILAFDNVLIRLPNENSDLSKFNAHSLIAALQDAVRIIQCTDNLICRLTVLISDEVLDTKLINISPIPSCAVAILKKSYSHCKNSETLYGKLFEYTSNALGVLFQETYTLQKSLSCALGKIKFPQDESTSDELRASVVEILDGLLCICEIINGMDNMLLWKTWKLLLALMAEFRTVVNKELSPLCYFAVLCKNIKECIQYTIQLFTQSSHLLSSGDEPTNKSVARSSKFSTIFMTSLCELIKIFEGVLRIDAYNTVINFIRNLYTLMKPRIQLSARNGEVVKGMEMKFLSSVFSEIEAVVTLLVSDDSFIGYFSETGTMGLDPDYGSLNFIISVARILARPSSVANIWLQLTENRPPALLVLQLLVEKTLQVPSDLNSLVIGEGTSCLLYNTIVIHFCALASCVPTSFFPLLEELLMKNVLALDQRRSILASDILVFLCRSSRPLCDYYFSILCETLKETDQMSAFPLVIKSVVCVLKRIFHNLSEREIHKMRNGRSWMVLLVLPEISESRWSKIYSAICVEFQNENNVMMEIEFSINRLKNLTMSCENFLKWLESSQDKSFDLIHQPSLVSVLSSVLKLWFMVHEDVKRYSVLPAVRKFITVFCRIVKFVLPSSSSEISNVLTSLCRFVQSNLHLIELEFIQALHEIEKQGNSHLNEDELCKVFSCLLMDRNWRIRHETMKCFEMMFCKANGTQLLEKCAVLPSISSKIEDHFSFEYLNTSSLAVSWQTGTTVLQRYTDWQSEQLKILADFPGSKVETKGNEGNDLVSRAICNVRNTITELTVICQEQGSTKDNVSDSILGNLNAVNNLLKVVTNRFGI